MMERLRNIFLVMLVCIMSTAAAFTVFGTETEAGTEIDAGAETETDAQTESENAEYTLDKVVILSRHNIRSPLSEKGSVLDELTPHDWFKWTSKTGELSLKGGLLEIEMGQYFRQWLEKEGLFPENYVPEDGAVRFYANGLQRTQATANYFSTGLLPVANVTVERKGEPGETDDTFLPKIYYLDEEYEQEVLDDIYARGGGDKLAAWRQSLDRAFNLVSDVLDMKDSEGWKSGKYGNFLEDETTISLEIGSEPKLTGPLNTAVSLADALVLQYYEEEDELKAAFGHKLGEDDWKTIGSILEMNLKLRFGTPSLAVNQAHLMLEELYNEMNTDGRKLTFLCGHDSTISSVLSALGVNEYTLPNAIEPTVPIGSKIVFARWTDADNEAYYRVCIVYQSVDQLRSIRQLTLDNPPMIVPLSFRGVDMNKDGMIAEQDLMKLFEDRIDSYYALDQRDQDEELDQAA